MRRPLLIIIAIVIFACNKKSETPDPIKPEDKAKAAALTEFLKNEKFRLKKYYSETPIDYIDTDNVVKAETDLWPYVSEWLKDDAYDFNQNGEVLVEQNAVKIQTDNSPVLTKQYSVKADIQGVAFDFLGHEYQKLTYRLISFTDSNLVVSAQWNGKVVISDFSTLP
jgi:hypothetical protein